jgi:hypothetical protein
MKNITPTLPSPLRGGGLGWGGQRVPEVKSCDHRKNRYGPLNIGATANFRNILLHLLSKLSDAEDDEFRRFDWSNTDQTDEPSVIDVILGHRRPVTFHQEGLLGFGPHEGAVFPDPGEKVCDGCAHPPPELFAAGFEDDPLGTFSNRLFEVKE